MDGVEFLAFARSVASGVYDDDLAEIIRVCRERQGVVAQAQRQEAERRQGKLLGMPGTADWTLPPGGD